ncbi:RecB family exonuclease [Blastococcus sp. Marseille-P5729]|uniref:RecB family exonuclease n=1 Tax=Blastococcus sp. Marseille-P5729 TaxID=2086582 RepID=UPI001F3ADE81|nr:RecB family exonuclease [Blastococcus sp. Marseille-P5729]
MTHLEQTHLDQTYEDQIPTEQIDLGVVTGSLSPSRAADFKTCPLLYRFRSVDRLPERPSAPAVRGTVVHAVLEKMFDLPRDQRTPSAARAMVQPAWEQVLADDPEMATLFADDEDGVAVAKWLESAQQLLTTYFELEDPRRFDPTGRELLVETVLDDGLLLRGYVDRVDTAPDGRVRVVDYKTGASPREAFEAKALFQMKFYALVIWRTTGTIPAQLKLMYLADRDELMYSPDESELVKLEQQLTALWSAIRRSIDAKEFRPRPSRLCDWCDHKALCPAYGGTPPPFPEEHALSFTINRRTERPTAD